MDSERDESNSHCDCDRQAEMNAGTAPTPEAVNLAFLNELLAEKCAGLSRS
jgi:hypothetical protein